MWQSLQNTYSSKPKGSHSTWIVSHSSPEQLLLPATVHRYELGEAVLWFDSLWYFSYLTCITLVQPIRTAGYLAHNSAKTPNTLSKDKAQKPQQMKSICESPKISHAATESGNLIKAGSYHYIPPKAISLKR